MDREAPGASHSLQCQDHQRFLPGLELGPAIPCLCQQVWHVPAEPHPGCGAPGCFGELLRRRLSWEMCLGNAALPIAEPPPGAAASIIHCRAGRLGSQHSQHSQHSQPCCWRALGLLCHLLIPARILVKLWKSSGEVAGGQEGLPGLQVSSRCWEPGSSQPPFLGHPPPTAGSALAWGEGETPSLVNASCWVRAFGGFLS